MLLDIGPFETVASRVETAIQLLLQDEGEETAEHMAPDRFISLVEYRSCLQHRLDVSKDLLDLPEIFVLECNLFR